MSGNPAGTSAPPAAGGSPRWGMVPRHLRTTSVRSLRLFDPTGAWLMAGMLTWVAAMAHQKTCDTQRIGHPTNAMLRLCYSDLPITFQNQLAQGQHLYSSPGAVPQPPLTVMVMSVLRLLVAQVHPVGADTTAQQALNGGYLFLKLAALVFGLCALVVLVGQLVIRRSLGRPETLPDPRLRTAGLSWTLLASCVTIFTAGLISWELLAAAPLTGTLVAWFRRRWLLAGVLAGLTVSASGHLAAIVVVMAVLSVVEPAAHGIRRSLPEALTRVASSAGVAIAVALTLNLPAALLWPRGWFGWVRATYAPEVGLGSVVRLSEASGSFATWWARGSIVAALLAGLVLIACVVAGRLRPNAAEFTLMLVGVWLLCAPTYSPQFALLLLPLVAVVRSGRWAAVFAFSEAIYWGAVWAFLNGSLRFGEHGGEVPYGLAILVRATVLTITIVAVVTECWRRPWPGATATRDDDGLGWAHHRRVEAGVN